MRAVAYDVPIPGYDTPTTNNLRLWSSKASGGEFDFQKFNSGDYESSVADQQRAETISAVLYPNDNLERGKELRLKQQYFWVAASLYDIVRRFKKSKRPWKEFSDQVAIQLNDTHPTLAIVELQRILVDIEGLEWDVAWDIVTNTVSSSASSPTNLHDEQEESVYQSTLTRRIYVVWVHQPHCPPRGIGEVARRSIPAPSPASPPNHLRYQPLFPTNDREGFPQRQGNSPPRVNY